MISSPGNSQHSTNVILEANQVHLGQPFKCNRNPQLKFLIQTGHYTIPGVYKWRVGTSKSNTEHIELCSERVQPFGKQGTGDISNTRI